MSGLFFTALRAVWPTRPKRPNFRAIPCLGAGGTMVATKAATSSSLASARPPPRRTARTDDALLRLGPRGLSEPASPKKPMNDPHASRLVVAFAVAILAAGCSSSAATSGYKAGEFGNGGFYFSCDDAMSCAPYSNDAAKFPKAVSLGSTFQVRFVAATSSDSTVRFNERAPDRGVTINAVGSEYVSRGPDGFLALKAGHATLAARDAANQIIDYVIIRVAKPDALFVYPADETKAGQRSIDKLDLVIGGESHVRAFAKAKNEVLAGSLRIEWISADPTIADVELTADGTAAILAKKVGTTKITATGGTFSDVVDVEVKP